MRPDNWEKGSSHEQSRGVRGGEAGVSGGSLVQPNRLKCLNCFQQSLDSRTPGPLSSHHQPHYSSFRQTFLLLIWSLHKERAQTRILSLSFVKYHNMLKKRSPQRAAHAHLQPSGFGSVPVLLTLHCSSEQTCRAPRYGKTCELLSAKKGLKASKFVLSYAHGVGFSVAAVEVISSCLTLAPPSGWYSSKQDETQSKHILLPLCLSLLLALRK